MQNKTKSSTIKTFKKNLNLRGALLILQILLPFGLNFALGWESQVLAGLIAGLFSISMLFLIWLG
jgi:hypothetical protein